jgi:hypothetical protein
MPHYPFDDSILTWHKLDWLENVWYYVYDVDRKNRIVDALFKFAPYSKAMLHQHKTPYVTLVLQGELRFYRPNGELKEIRPVGSYVQGVANGEPHMEGGGDQETIVFFSVRNIESELFLLIAPEARGPRFNERGRELGQFGESFRTVAVRRNGPLALPSQERTGDPG